jgi:hypothetical protein
MRPSTFAVAAFAAGIALAGMSTAHAQYYNNDVVAHCARQVSQFKFEGFPADRNRDMMMLACEQNGGTVPGAVQTERPAGLRTGTTKR